MKYVFLFLMIFVAACVSTQPITGKGVSISMDANPQQVFSDGTVTVTVDVENHDAKTVKDVNVDIFDAGSLKLLAVCEKNFGDLEPNDFKTFACNLKAGKVEQKTDNTIWARATYKSSLAAVQTVDIISQTEAELRKKSGKTTEAQKSFSFKDSNLELVTELSNSPIADTKGKREVVTFSIKNIGSGFIEKLNKDDIKITAGNADMQCSKQDLFIAGKEFPKFSCAINLKGDIVSFITAEISININYNYEIRSSTSVRIIK